MEEGESLVLDFEIKRLLTRKQVRNASATLLTGIFEVSQQPSLLSTLLWNSGGASNSKREDKKGDWWLYITEKGGTSALQWFSGKCSYASFGTLQGNIFILEVFQHNFHQKQICYSR